MTGRQPATGIAERPGRTALDPADSYLAGVLSVIRPLPPRRLGLDNADGAVLAEDAGRDIVLARSPRAADSPVGRQRAGRARRGTGPGRTWESNSFMLAAARQAGCVTRRHQIIRDGRGAVLTAVQESLPGTDLLVTSGTVTPAPGRSSHQLTALARCDALIIVPEQVTALPAGCTAEVLELPS